MDGINALTGKPLTGLAHLRQSISDILTTPIGSRVMRRDYGSRLYSLVDAPLSPSTILDMYAAAAEALALWEPRVAVESFGAEITGPGKVSLSMRGRYTVTGDPFVIEGLEIT